MYIHVSLSALHTVPSLYMIKRVYKFPQFFLFIAKNYLLKLTLDGLKWTH